MGRSQETYNKKEARNKKEKKRKEKEKKRLARKNKEKKSGLDDMIAYVDENGVISSTPPDPNKRTEVDAEEIEVSVPKDDLSLKNITTHQGIVTFYNESKGYGFIRDMATRQSVFFHVSNLLQPVTKDNLVSFEIEKGNKGLSAQNIQLIRS